MTDRASPKRVHVVDCEWKEACEIEAHWASPLSADHRPQDCTCGRARCAFCRLYAEVAALHAELATLAAEAERYRAALWETMCRDHRDSLRLDRPCYGEPSMNTAYRNCEIARDALPAAALETGAQ